MNKENPFVWPITIYYEDTDVGGVVYHSNYLKFFERARTELLRSIGVSQQKLFAEHISFVVRHMDIDFLRGAQLDEQLQVQTWVESIGRATLIFVQQLVRADNTILCRALVKIACINPTTMKPTAIPNGIKMEIVP